MQLNKKIILFDIDYTLFDVGHFDKNFHKHLAKLFFLDEKLIREKSLEVIVALIKKDRFLDIDKYFEIFLSKIGKEEYRKELEEFLFGKDFFRKGFYPETEVTLRTLKSMFRLGVFSQGDEKLQGAKINQSGFKHLFEKDLIYIRKPRKIDFLPYLKEKHKKDKVFLVDDKLEVLQLVKSGIPSVFTIWVKRGKYAENQRPIIGFKPDAEIVNLKEVVKLAE